MLPGGPTKVLIPSTEREVSTTHFGIGIQATLEETVRTRLKSSRVFAHLT
jgi:hypothetical protein